MCVSNMNNTSVSMDIEKVNVDLPFTYTTIGECSCDIDNILNEAKKLKIKLNETKGYEKVVIETISSEEYEWKFKSNLCMYYMNDFLHMANKKVFDLHVIIRNLKDITYIRDIVYIENMNKNMNIEETDNKRKLENLYIYEVKTTRYTAEKLVEETNKYTNIIIKTHSILDLEESTNKIYRILNNTWQFSSNLCENDIKIYLYTITSLDPLLPIFNSRLNNITDKENKKIKN